MKKFHINIVSRNYFYNVFITTNTKCFESVAIKDSLKHAAVE